jgi:hypothetical protein
MHVLYPTRRLHDSKDEELLVGGDDDELDGDEGWADGRRDSSPCF